MAIDEPPIQLSAEQLLYAFDRARRDLTRGLMGTVGEGGGYNAVHVNWAALRAVRAGSTLTVFAMVRKRSGRRQLIEYVATSAPPVAFDGELVRTAEIARAQGWALVDATHRRGIGLPAARVATEVGT